MSLIYFLFFQSYKKRNKITYSITYNIKTAKLKKKYLKQYFQCYDYSQQYFFIFCCNTIFLGKQTLITAMTSFTMLRYYVANLFHCLTIINIIIIIAFLFYNMNKKIYNITYRLRKKPSKEERRKNKNGGKLWINIKLSKKKTHRIFEERKTEKGHIRGVRDSVV